MVRKAKKPAETRRTSHATRGSVRAAAPAAKSSGSRKAAADRRGVSDATARAQLTSIFDKTGVRKQTDLMRLLLAED